MRVAAGGEPPSGQPYPFVSVVIPVFNDAERLEMCLRALEDQTYPADRYEVILVDNGSDASMEGLAAGFAGTRVAYEDRPGSYAARNKGVSLARGEVVAFTDSDCVPDRDWIERGVEALCSAPGLGLAGGRINVSFGDPARPTAVELFEGVMAFPQRRYVEQEGFGVTANLFTPRSVFESVGLFDEELKSGGDYEWGRRVRSAGYGLVYADAARVTHPARRSVGELSRKVARVTGGERGLKRGANRRLVSLLPPVKTMLRLLKDERLNGAGEKARVVCVLLLVRYVQVWERLRLGLGGEPRR